VVGLSIAGVAIMYVNVVNVLHITVIIVTLEKLYFLDIYANCSLHNN